MTKIEIFQAENGAIEFKGDSNHETVWANLEQISQLFKRDKSGISRHIKNIYKSEELEEKETVAIFATAQNIVDKYLIFFNGDDNYELVAEDEEILDENLYSLFVKGFEDE